MTNIQPESTVATDASRPTGSSARSKFKRHLLAGVATLALLAAGSVYTLRAYSADAIPGGSAFGATSAARVPANPIMTPGLHRPGDGGQACSRLRARQSRCRRPSSCR